MILAGRSLQDLVIIDPDLDLYRYNPLDPNQTADENASKLAKVQKILGTSSGGDNAYWDQTSQATIKNFLQLLEVYKPKHKIGLDDIARFMRDDDLAGVLCDTVEKTIEEKRASSDISEEAYGAYTDAISSTRNAWINLNQNTKSTLKTTITNMLGPIASNPRLQKVFCRDTNFSFRDLPNQGKVVLFRGSGIDKSTARLICVCLKIDFQTWQKRRNGSAAAAYGLNTMRTVLFICDEYQEFVTCGGEGDETFYGVSRSTRTAPIVATQSYNSLETAIKNKEQTKTLRQNIATWVFFRSTDQDTCELGKFLAGQSKKEDFSTSQDTTGLLEAAAMSSGGGKSGSSISISKKLEENFRADDFSRLVTMTMEKSRTGPWYSEAIVYHYHDIDESAESRCYKTRLSHLYYDTKLRKQASLNVRHLDHILYDRNWQRKVLQRGLLKIQRTIAADQEEQQEDLERTKATQVSDTVLREAEENPQKAAEKERIRRTLQKNNINRERDAASMESGGIPGALLDDDDGEETQEALLAKIEQLRQDQIHSVDPAEKETIQVQIEDKQRKISRFILQSAAESSRNEREILRANELPFGEDPEESEEGDFSSRLESTIISPEELERETPTEEKPLDLSEELDKDGNIIDPETLETDPNEETNEGYEGDPDNNESDETRDGEGEDEEDDEYDIFDISEMMVNNVSSDIPLSAITGDESDDESPVNEGVEEQETAGGWELDDIDVDIDLDIDGGEDNDHKSDKADESGSH
jgi:hypothetical protein